MTAKNQTLIKLVLFAAILSLANYGGYYFLSSQFKVNSEKSAIKISEEFIGHIYGSPTALDQRPYRAFLVDRVWVVKGRKPAPESFGGGFEIYVSALNGEIIEHMNNK